MLSDGFNVIDLGVSKFIETIKQYKPKEVGISRLLTTCFDNIKDYIKLIEMLDLITM